MHMPAPRLSEEGRARRLTHQRERQIRRRATRLQDAREAARASDSGLRRSARIRANQARLAETPIHVTPPQISEEQRVRRLAHVRERQVRRRAALPLEAREAARAADTGRRRSARILANEARLAEARIQVIEQHRFLRSYPTPLRSFGMARDITNRPSLHSLGRMDQPCSSCSALHFLTEKVASSRTVYNMCCNLGKFSMQPFQRFPALLRQLLKGRGRRNDRFRSAVRNYNSGLAMASMVAHVDSPGGGGPYCYKIHGQVYHFVGALRPTGGLPPQYAQILIMDTEQAAAELAARQVNSDCDSSLFADLHRLLLRVNPYAQSFVMMDEVLRTEEETAIAAGRTPHPVHMVFGQRPCDDARRYNSATANEVAVVYVGDEEDIVLVAVSQDWYNLLYSAYVSASFAFFRAWNSR
ncbi:unnamed protein product [Heligmosomoides polygyrus]|uniref:Helitron_like_N domain-containing protein n=1 Tax=Heligmosomoides polygyrus TaxID=6339 RepID=A0A183GQ47_HELPZ|nr:unnamed protein product [Heligmosomoides polygyrus]